jgi:hypothetical protein
MFIVYTDFVMIPGVPDLCGPGFREFRYVLEVGSEVHARVAGYKRSLAR